MEAQSKRVDVGKVVSESFSLYGEHAATLLGAALAVVGVVALIQGLLAATGSLLLIFLGSILSLVANVLYTGFVVKLVEDIRDGRRDFSVGELLSAAAPFIGTLILNGILWGLGVFVGFLLLIVPGLILITIWAVTAPAIVIERVGPVEAFGRSRELVRGEGWAVFGVIIVAFLITLVIGAIAGGIGAAVGDAGTVVLRVIGGVIAAPITALVSAVLFFDLGGGSHVTAAVPAGAPPPPPPPPPSPAA